MCWVPAGVVEGAGESIGPSQPVCKARASMQAGQCAGGACKLSPVALIQTCHRQGSHHAWNALWKLPQHQRKLESLAPRVTCKALGRAAKA